MAKQRVGIIGANGAEKAYFRRNLEDYELEFYEADVSIDELDRNLEILSVFTNFTVGRTVIDVLPKLKMIACRSTGFDNIDTAYAKKKKITVANTPGYGKTSVAEYVFALLLALSRKITVTLDEEKENDDINREIERGFDLFGKTIGIVGLGAIGQGVAKIASGFGMNVIAYDAKIDEQFAHHHKVQIVETLDALLRLADIVTLHVPFSSQNIHLLGGDKIALMKKNAILINTARGELVDTVALVKALNEKQIAGAALDVIEEEYLLDPREFIRFASEESESNKMAALRHATALLALERMDNVIITNHNAFNTTESLRAIHRMTVENITGKNVHRVV